MPLENHVAFRPITFIKRCLMALAGASYEDLSACPRWEQRKYEAFGATVLVPSIFGVIASAYAVSTLTDQPWIIWGFAAIWGFIILTIDRALLTTYRAFASWDKKLIQGILRFLVAFLLGFTIAHPLTLLLFKDTIVAEVERQRAVEVQAIRAEAQVNKTDLEQRIAAAESSLADHRKRYEETISASYINDSAETGPDQASAMDVSGREAVEVQIEQATESQRTQIAELDRQLGTHQERYVEVQEGLSHWQQEYEAEIGGSRSGSAGIGPRARSIEVDQLAPRRAEAQRLQSLMQNLTAQRNQLSTEVGDVEKRIRTDFAAATAAEAEAIREDQQQVAALQRQLQKQQLSIFVDKQDELLSQIQVQIDSVSEELKRLREESSQLASDTQSQITLVQEQRRADLLTQTLALHHLFESGAEGGKFALLVYVILAALFVVIDTIPIVVKFFSNPGPYDIIVCEQDPTTSQRVRERMISMAREENETLMAQTSHERDLLKHKLEIEHELRELRKRYRGEGESGETTPPTAPVSIPAAVEQAPESPQLESTPVPEPDPMDNLEPEPKVDFKDPKLAPFPGYSSSPVTQPIPIAALEDLPRPIPQKSPEVASAPSEEPLPTLSEIMNEVAAQGEEVERTASLEEDSAPIEASENELRPVPSPMNPVTNLGFGEMMQNQSDSEDVSHPPATPLSAPEAPPTPQPALEVKLPGPRPLEALPPAPSPQTTQPTKPSTKTAPISLEEMDEVVDAVHEALRATELRREFPSFDSGLEVVDGESPPAPPSPASAPAPTPALPEPELPPKPEVSAPKNPSNGSPLLNKRFKIKAQGM